MHSRKFSTARYAARSLLLVILPLLLAVSTARGQTTTFTYQGQLLDGGTPANGTYDMQFKLFDAVSAGSQIGSTITNSTVNVSNGSFTVRLDYGASAFPGLDRFLEISSRLAGSGNPYTVLSPRQQLTSTPYAIRSLNASSADAVMVSGVPSGSGNYIQNTTSPQAGASFNISGDGTAGGTLSGNMVNAASQYRLGGNLILHNGGNISNLFAGVGPGISILTGNSNAFFGYGAGTDNTTASANSFFGANSGNNNETGPNNSFFGYRAGYANVSAGDNSFFGANAGQANTGTHNSFFGSSAGFNNTGDAGSKTGSDNAFVGYKAGFSNTTGDDNSFFGSNAGFSNTMGGANSFFGSNAGFSNTMGGANSFFGSEAGAFNSTGIHNVYIGAGAGRVNTTGQLNTFVGDFAGATYNKPTGNLNTFIGGASGSDIDGVFKATAIGSSALVHGATNATAIGADAYVSQSNSLVLGHGVNVGIGTVAPSLGKLDVEDNGFFTGVQSGTGVYGTSTALSGNGVVGEANNGAIAIGVWGKSTSGYAGYFTGNVNVTGNLTKGGGSFKIDHPLDPENKYLSHSFVESPDMMNIYNGNITTDARGFATVLLPDYFTALNRDFRYQLTVIGRFAQAIVAREIKNNRFVIRTSKPRMKVSWQVTGIRQDAFANAHRIKVEEDKTGDERGRYLYPKLFGQPEERGVEWARKPENARPKAETNARTKVEAAKTEPRAQK